MPRGDQAPPLDVGVSQLIKYTVELYICCSTVFNFFLIPSLYRLIALNTLFTMNLKQKSLYLPLLSFQIPLQSACFPNRKRSLFAPQGWTCLRALSPSKANRPSAGGQGRRGQLLSPDSSALVFNPLVTRLPNQPGRGGPRGLGAVPGVPRQRGPVLELGRWTQTALSALRALWSSHWSAALVGHSLMSWGFLHVAERGGLQ